MAIAPYSAEGEGSKTKTGPRKGPANSSTHLPILLDLGFLELDVLARDRVILLLDQLVGHGARILLGDVVEAGVGRGHELDLDGDRFGHVLNLRKSGESGAGQTARVGRQPSQKPGEVKDLGGENHSNR